MNPDELFEVLAEVAREHAEYPGEELLVIPVLLDETGTRPELLEEVSEVLGGILLDVGNGHFGGPLEAYDDAELRAAVATGLRVERPLEDTELQLSVSGDVIDAQLLRGGKAVKVPATADQQILALSRALFEKRLENKEFAMLLYNETVFDKFGQEAVLSMLTGLGRAGKRRIGGARTLVVFIKSDGFDIGRHCQPNRGIRFSLAGPTLIRRHEHTHLDDTVKKLIAKREPPLVLFLAAGFSASSDMPVGNSVRDDAIRRICEVDDAKEMSSEELAGKLYQFAKHPTRKLLSEREKMQTKDQFVASLTLEQVVRMERDHFDQQTPQTLLDLAELHQNRLTGGKPLGESIYAIRNMIESGRRMILVTVNYDELIEHEHAGRLDVTVSDEEFAAITPILKKMAAGEDHPGGKIPLLKMHGTISDLVSCVACDDTTRAGISPEKSEALLAIVRGVSENNQVPWVYVGASMRDIDLQTVFAQPEFVEHTSERWVSPLLDPSVERFVHDTGRFTADELYERTVTETSDTFMHALAEKWVSGY